MPFLMKKTGALATEGDLKWARDEYAPSHGQTLGIESSVSGHRSAENLRKCRVREYVDGSMEKSP